MPNTPRNIVFIMADQLAAGFVGCYGSGVDSTPTLDRLASSGIRFDRCYATSPVCAPNRATFATGRSPQVHGIISNNYLMPADNPTYAHVLGHHGYNVGGFGKFHLAPMPQQHPENYEYLGFDESVITEDPKWGPYIDWIRREHPEHFETALAMAWGNPRHLPEDADDRMRQPKLQEIRQRILQPVRQASDWGMFYTSPLPAELHQTTYITDLSLDFMRRHMEERPDQPFLCHVSYVDPHCPYDPPEPYGEMFDAEDMPDPIPASWTERGNAVLEKAKTWQGFDQIVENTRIVREMRAKYHGSIRFINDQIARIVNFLDKQNLWDDTVLVFTTDHGDMMGDHELNTKGVKPYDTSIRCPLIVAGADAGNGSTNRLTCSLDFFPTFCDWAGIEPEIRPPLEGRSFQKVAAGENEPEPWDCVSVAFGSMESIISDDGWRLTVFEGEDSPNQLINLVEDPDEQHNLYSDEKHSEARRQMLEKMSELHVRLRQAEQYRTLPVKDNARFSPGGAGNGRLNRPLPLYGPEAKRWAKEAPVGGSDENSNPVSPA